MFASMTFFTFATYIGLIWPELSGYDTREFWSVANFRGPTPKNCQACDLSRGNSAFSWAQQVWIS